MALIDITKAGYCPEEDITRPTPKMADAFIKFMEQSNNWWAANAVYDVGEFGYKSLRMSEYKLVNQLTADDFNFHGLLLKPYFNVPKDNDVTDYTTAKAFAITCFETIEHVQNPLFFMQSIMQWLHPNGSIFLSTPARPRFLWTEHHFFEMDANHLQKWILNPLGLEIVRKKRVHIGHHWSFYFKGIRPFFRLFLNWTWIYEIKNKRL